VGQGPRGKVRTQVPTDHDDRGVLLLDHGEQLDPVVGLDRHHVVDDDVRDRPEGGIGVEHLDVGLTREHRA
jgi:hypothetical protein